MRVELFNNKSFIKVSIQHNYRYSEKYSVAQQDECCQIRAESVVQNTTQEWTTEETAGRKTLYRIAKCHIPKTFRCALTGSGNNGRPKARWNVQITVWIEDRQTYIQGSYWGHI